MGERVLEVRVRFLTPCLGNVRGAGGKFFLPRRDGAGGPVVFSPRWHGANMAFASRSCGDGAPPEVAWDPVVGGETGERPWVQRRVDDGRGRPHFAVHEAFKAGACVSLRCRPGPGLTAERLRELMQCAGRHRGLSPWRGSGGYGRFEVVELREVSGFHGE